MASTELAISPAVWLLVVGLGGLLALDGVSFPQVMVSRPLVSATIGGAIMGSPSGGMLVGAVLELLSMRHAPFGAAKYPDTGPAGLVAGAAYAAAGAASIQALVAALIGGWFAGWAGSYAGHARRRLNGWLLDDPDGLAASPGRLERRMYAALAIDVGRGALVTAGFFVPVALAAALAAGFTIDPGATAFGVAALVTSVAAAIGAGARISAPDVRAWAIVLAGALVTAAALWWVTG